MRTYSSVHALATEPAATPSATRTKTMLAFRGATVISAEILASLAVIETGQSRRNPKIYSTG